MKLPSRIFLDTSVVNFIVDYSEQIFDRVPFDNPTDRVYDDLLAMATIYSYGNHNPIEMIISKTTLDEVNATMDPKKRRTLQRFCSELARHFHFLIGDDYRVPGYELKYFEEFLWDKGLNKITDDNDRRLILEALFYKCDIFCTRDYRTILKHRLQLKWSIPIEILTPFEWCRRYSYVKAY